MASPIARNMPPKNETNHLLAPGRRSAPDRLIDAWAQYRIALSLLLILLSISPLEVALRNFSIAMPLLVLNIAVGAIALAANRTRRVAMMVLVASQMAADFLIATLLTYLGGGSSGGFGTLFVVPIGLGALFLPQRAAILPAAIASLVLLTVEYRLSVDLVDYQAAWPATGLLGAVLFLAAILANNLAQRARLDEQIARVAAASLGQMRQLAAKVVERMQAAVVVIDSDGFVVFTNAASQKLLSIQASGIALPEQEPELWEATRTFLANPAAEEFTEIQLRSGHSIWPHFTRLSGTPPLVLIVIDDPTHIARQRQQARLAAIGHVTAGVAHDVRNPLAAISNATQLLQEAPDDNPQPLLAVIRRQTLRLNRVVERIHDLARPIQPRTEVFELRSFLEEWAADYQAPESQAFHLKVNCQQNLPAVQLDPSHLAECLDNLADNAVRHAKPSGPLCMQIRGVSHMQPQSGDSDADSQSLALYFEDNGIEPLHANHDKAFEAYSGEGRLGLGLTLCRELMEANRAQIVLCRPHSSDTRPADSEWLGGTCFELTLPAQPLREL